MLRDGRDATLSINVEWRKRVAILEDNRNILKAFQVFSASLDRQLLLKHKIQSILFEIANPINLLRGQLQMSHRARRWHGRAGWGPRFPGWDDVIDKMPTLAFNAKQWATCVAAVLNGTQHLTPDQFLEVRYETLLNQPEREFARIFDFLNVQKPNDLLNRIPNLKSGNHDKWRSEFSKNDLKLIGPILQPLLQRTGYADSEDWYRGDAAQ
jgi:hypothetical protein